MDRDHADAPAFWAEELARSDEDIAAGNVVPAQIVHDRLRAAIAELEAEIAADGEASTTETPAR